MNTLSKRKDRRASESKTPFGRQLFRRSRISLSICSAFCAGLLLSSSIATAAESDVDQLIELLVQRGVITTEDAAVLREQVGQEEGAELVGVDLGYEPTIPAQDDNPSIQVFPFTVQSEDNSDIFRFRGRFQLDAAAQDFDDGMIDVARESNKFPDYGVIVRRARLAALGVIDERWEWQIEVDFAENLVELENVYMAYLMPKGRLAVGKFKEPFTMEYATSSRYVDFIERASPVDAHKVDKEPGIMYETVRPNWYAGIGVFGSGIAINREVEEGWSTAGRLSYAPYLKDDGFIHIGGSWNQRRNAFNEVLDRYEDLRLRTREGTRAIDARLIGRDDLIAVKDINRFGLELAAGKGSWWMKSEYIRNEMDLDRVQLTTELGGNAVTGNSITQDGWYIQTGYFLTGESKPYRGFSGDFGRLHPNRNFSAAGGNPGAIEVAFRYAIADSLEHTRVGRGQKLENWTAGLNWYLTPEIMVRGNAIYLKGERSVFEGDGWVYAVRMQYLF